MAYTIYFVVYQSYPFVSQKCTIEHLLGSDLLICFHAFNMLVRIQGLNVSFRYRCGEP